MTHHLIQSIATEEAWDLTKLCCSPGGGGHWNWEHRLTVYIATTCIPPSLTPTCTGESLGLVSAASSVRERTDRGQISPTTLRNHCLRAFSWDREWEDKNGGMNTRTHTHTHTRAHARTHSRTHTHTEEGIRRERRWAQQQSVSNCELWWLRESRPYSPVSQAGFGGGRRGGREGSEDRSTPWDQSHLPCDRWKFRIKRRSLILIADQP